MLYFGNKSSLIYSKLNEKPVKKLTLKGKQLLGNFTICSNILHLLSGSSLDCDCYVVETHHRVMKLTKQRLTFPMKE